MARVEDDRKPGKQSSIPPDIDVLQLIIRERGLLVSPPDRTIERLLMEGIPVLDYSTEQPTLPTEEILLQGILQQFPDKEELPYELIDYLYLRGYLKEEHPTVRGLVKRQLSYTLSKMGVAINSALERAKSKKVTP